MILGYDSMLGNTNWWHFILTIPGIAGLIQLTFLPFMPESPRYLLITKGHMKEGKTALCNLRGTSSVNGELYEILNEVILECIDWLAI